MSTFTFLCRVLATAALVGAIYFTSAGRWDLPVVWSLLGVMVAFFLGLVAFAEPALLRERRAPGPGNRDRLTRPLAAGLLLAHWVIAGLDVGRLHWSVISWEVQVAGLAGYAAALALVFWAMSVNPFYSCVVRVQTERGHYPATAGPYRWVRHPGYAGTLLALLTGGVALGSWLALLPILGVAGLFVRRTLLEDRLLQRELPGYAAYAGRVRHRLIVGLF
jgi:protein-S-isoprenylcysteine O-methyltransferase Ste14